MGVGDVVRGSFGFLLNRNQHVPIAAANINLTPSNAFHSLFYRHREAPLPITPVSIIKSMLQIDDLQALLWAWTLIGILLLFAFWTNPDEASFRPFLTDLVFRERLRLLQNDQHAHESQLPSHDAAVAPPTTEPAFARKSDPSAFSSLISTTSYSSGPFALTFGAKVVLSVRTPPFHRKDLGLLSIVTISQSSPARGSNDHQSSPSQTSRRTQRASAKSDGSIDCTSLFIGAFGKWWVLGYAIPDLPATSSSNHFHPPKNARPELEENMTDIPDWGVLEMRSVDPDPQSRRSSVQASRRGPQGSASQPSSRQASGSEPTAPITSPSHPLTTTSASSKDSISATESQDCISIAALVSRSQSEIVDLQGQLSHVRSASARTCEALEADLEEVRAKKKEEEKLRSDIKSRTKALDDSKRQVESTRREAERRLKTVNAARALKQASIQQRKDQVDMLHKRRAAINAKKAAHTEKRLQRSEELLNLISQAKDKADKLRSEMDTLRKDVQAAQDQLQLEKAIARNIQEADHRDQSRVNASPYMWNPAMEYNQMASHEAMYAHLASTPDPLVDSLARMEERALAAQQYTSSPFDAEPGLAINKMPTAHADGYDNLGTSVLRNAFRRANAASVGEGREMLSHASPGIGNPSLQNASNFEAIKQAFQPTIATEEDGRRSWSAFDVWQSDLRSGSRQNLQWASGTANASADSLPQFSASSSFLPLDRSTSAEQTGFAKFQDQEGDPEQNRNLSKVKRAFRWPFRPSQVQDDFV
ncbi:uncharacterized protein UMAG_10438 [Mycosarcoma maydis]|uniref:Uncharacterized protein n=1 Tax=Mycosarcoma maydis TaxID=5270 RepID=A0A0D1C3N8_MYCMD|nr:uncharacterized protein UMAG_10438 [Ustilago maydis 521]KIS68342.1 hypothetical protein UMAG_10438 [Ustilago maydis 521]|eukprot:XP_011390056.1 hypothetical protein UMAG_10438 [Ustilago maydis 521]